MKDKSLFGKVSSLCTSSIKELVRDGDSMVKKCSGDVDKYIREAEKYSRKIQKDITKVSNETIKRTTVYIENGLSEAARTTQEARKYSSKTTKEISSYMSDVVETKAIPFVKRVTGWLTIDVLRNLVRQKVPNALKIEIRKKKKSAVNVGVFDTNDKVAANLEITATDGISNMIKEGSVYYL